MGRVIDAADVISGKIYPQPLFYIEPTGINEEKIISINNSLARELLKLDESSRSLHIEKIFQKIINNLPENCVIKGFDAMFNPNYRINVLQIIINVHKYRHFRIIWPGTMKDGVLIYADNGRPDYKTFRILDYDIICCINE